MQRYTLSLVPQYTLWAFHIQNRTPIPPVRKRTVWSSLVAITGSDDSKSAVQSRPRPWQDGLYGIAKWEQNDVQSVISLSQNILRTHLFKLRRCGESKSRCIHIFPEEMLCTSLSSKSGSRVVTNIIKPLNHQKNQEIYSWSIAESKGKGYVDGSQKCQVTGQNRHAPTRMLVNKFMPGMTNEPVLFWKAVKSRKTKAGEFNKACPSHADASVASFPSSKLQIIAAAVDVPQVWVVHNWLCWDLLCNEATIEQFEQTIAGEIQCLQ